MASPSAAAVAAMKQRKAREPEPDKLVRLRERCQHVRGLDLEIAGIEERLAQKKEERHKIVSRELPDMMSELKMNSFDLDPVGNEPPYVVKSGPYYHANIRADWPDEQREKAFALLDSKDAPDMLKTVITIELGRGTSKLVKKITSALRKLKVAFTMSRGVPHPTLTAWLRELYENNGSLTADEKQTLGATVGMLVSIKPKSSKARKERTDGQVTH